MQWWQAAFLGVIQGLTEFLPISSSGHLAVTSFLLGLDAQAEIFFDVILHLGSLFAVCIYFWKEIRECGAGLLILAKQMFQPLGYPNLLRQSKPCQLVWFLFLATAVTGLLGLIFQPFLEHAFANLQ